VAAVQAAGHYNPPLTYTQITVTRVLASSTATAAAGAAPTPSPTLCPVQDPQCKPHD